MERKRCGVEKQSEESVRAWDGAKILRSQVIFDRKSERPFFLILPKVIDRVEEKRLVWFERSYRTCGEQHSVP